VHGEVLRTLILVDPTTAALLGGIGGLALGAVATFAIRMSDRSVRNEVVELPRATLPQGAAEVLAVLRSSAIVLDTSDRVVNNSPAAVAHGLVRGQELVHPELLALARHVRRDGVIRVAELELRKGPLGNARTVVAARIAPLGADHVLLLVDDLSEARRVEEIRRDFVANVSHELKTPVGGIALLAEAVLDAHDDPEAVARFARRISVESARLTRLVQEIVDLSRLQGADVIKDPVIVDVGACAAEAIDRCRLLAEDKGIDVVRQLQPECEIWGEPELITTAITNLVGNAITYSGDGVRVGVAVRPAGDLVEVAVTDQGQGIAPEEQERIFERFYRVDAARSRATGGTGLGLSIVKHIAENHGGQASVWSEVGHGSTFTLRLPAAHRAPSPGPERVASHASTTGPAATAVAD
jgi:two-component system sensor histidine kinase SenX3